MHVSAGWQVELRHMRACERRVPYIVALLRKGLAVPELHIRVGSGNEGWTLGAALAEGGRVGIGRPLIDKVLPLQKASDTLAA